MVQNQGKVFLSELNSTPLVIEIVQYRRYMYQSAWNVAVLIEKTQIYGKSHRPSEPWSTTIPTLN